MKSHLYLALILLSIPHLVLSSNETTSPNITLGKQETFTLTENQNLEGTYNLSLSEQNIPENKDKWYLFVLTEPSNDGDKIGRPSKIEIKKEGKDGKIKLIKKCQIEEELDSCFVKNNDFNYAQEHIVIGVTCPEQCKFNLMTEIDNSYKLKPNQSLKLDFQTTAYSKIFTLSTVGQQFDELRMIIKPEAFLTFPQPIQMLANYGDKVPTRENYDWKGIHLWDDGEGIFIRKSEMKSDMITILLSGPQKNVLIFSNEFKKNTEAYKLAQYQPYFDHLRRNQIKKYEIQLKTDIENAQIPFFIRVETFSGKVKPIKLYKLSSTKKLQIPLPEPNEKYGLVEFRLSSEYIRKNMLKNVQIQIEGEKESTFLIQFYAEQQKSSLLLPMLSKSSYMEENQIDQYRINVHELINEKNGRNSSKIQVRIGNIKGKVNVKFYSCNKKDSEQCYLNLQTKEGDKDIQKYLPKSVQSSKVEKTYHFDISWTLFQKEGEQNSEGLFRLIGVVQNIGKGTSQYEIQYKNKDRIHLLQQKKLVYDRIDIEQKRLYKYSNMDKDVTEIRVHLTMISGMVSYFGMFTDPRLDTKYEKIEPIRKIIYFSKGSQLSDIFVQVHGIENAYYSIELQLIRNSEKKPTDDGNIGYNELIIRETIMYEYVINSKQKMIFQLYPKEKEFMVHISSTLPLQICMTENLTSPPFSSHQSCDVLLKNVTKLNEQVVMEKGKVANFGVFNQNDNNVTFKIQISSEEAVCFEAELGIIMTKDIGEKGMDEDGVKTHCLSYWLHKYEDLEVVVSFSNNHYQNGSIAIIINEELIKITSPVHFFQKQELEVICKNEEVKETLCYMEIVVQNISNTEVSVVVQYTNAEVKLIDGIAHEVHSMMKKNDPKKFIFLVQNIMNTTVFLSSISGQYKIYGKFMSHRTYMIEKRDKAQKLFPSETEHDFLTKSPFYYLEQVYVVRDEQIKDKCFDEKEGDCIILLSVVLDGDEEIKNNGKFAIQCTQENRKLVKNQPVASFLEKHSVAFYQFQNFQENGTILISINNQNKRCLNIYVNEGFQRATISKFDKKVKNQNEMIIQKSKKGLYSITLQAVDHCPYIIEVDSNKNQLSKIRKGRFVDIDLQTDQHFNLLYHNLINETFKILFVHKTGQAFISVRTIQEQKLDEQIDNIAKKTKNWQWTGVDLVRIDSLHPNGKVNPNYCVNCYYLIDIKASRNSEGSILIPTPGVEIPIATDLMIKDLLLKGEKIVYRVFASEKAQFQIYIQYGELSFKVMDSNDNKTIYEKTFSAEKKPRVENFNIKNDQPSQFRYFNRVIIEAKEDSLFSFGMISDQDQKKRGNFLKYGIPTYLYLEKGKEKCVNGMVQSKGDKFLLSYSGTDQKIADSIQVNFKIGSQGYNLTKESAPNQMILKLPKYSISKADEFNLCLKNMKESLTLTLIQSSPIIYFPERQKIFVENQLNLTFKSFGTTTLEVDKCKGNPLIRISSEFNNLNSLSSTIKQTKKSQDIIEFSFYGPLFISAQMGKGTVRWIPYNEQEGRGIGYDNYRAGWLRISKNNNSLVLTAQALAEVVYKPSTEIEEVIYKVHTGKEDGDLFDEMNCGSSRNPYKMVRKSKGSLNQTIEVAFDVKQLRPSFERYQYFLIGMKAEVTVKNKRNEIQKYRFFYPYQEVQKQLLKESVPKPPVQETQQTNYLFYLVIIGIVVVVALLIYRRFLNSRNNRKYKNGGFQMRYSQFAESR